MSRAALAALLFCGCAAAKTGDAPAATVHFARFKTEGIVKERAIHLRQVDGKPVGGRRPSYTEQIELAPGDHTLKFYLYDSDGDGPGVPGEIPLAARAGGRYLLTFEQSEIRLKTAVWIEDRITGETVGGRAPAAAKPASPSAESEIARADWRSIPADKALTVRTKSGGVYAGTMISTDGEYFWIRKPEGGRKALLLSEIDKITRH